MMSEQRSSSADEVRCALQAINLHFIRMVLRPHGSIVYLEAEDALISAVRPLCLGMASFQADELLGELVCRWRAGRLTGFRMQYLRWVLADLRKQERGGPLAELPLAASGQASPELVVLARELITEFRASLTDPKDQALFAAWLESGDRQGWQREYANNAGVGDASVSLRLKKLRARLRQEQEIVDPDAFVREASSYLDDDGLASYNERRQQPAEATAAPSDHATWMDVADRLRRLRASFSQESRERLLMDAYGETEPIADIQARFPDEQELLSNLHRRYYQAARCENSQADA